MDDDGYKNMKKVTKRDRMVCRRSNDARWVVSRRGGCCVSRRKVSQKMWISDNLFLPRYKNSLS